jgi:transcriptional regulator with XRE-family HTH domain
MEQIYIEFGRLLKRRRKEANLTQDAIATKIGLVRTSVTNIEQGRQHVSLHMVFQLADAIGVRPQDLLPDRAPRPLSADLERSLGERPIDETSKYLIRRMVSNTQN